MICKQLNEVKAMVGIDEAQRLACHESGADFTPIITDVKIASIKKGGGPYCISFNALGERMYLARQRGGVREFSTTESAIKTCRTARLARVTVEFSAVEMMRALFSKQEEVEE